METEIEANIGKNKVLLVMGTRRVGKTFLLKTIEAKLNRRVLKLNGEDLDIQEMLGNLREANYKRIIGDAEVVFVDEAQAVPEVGKVLKLMIDSFPALTIIATGSSSFDLLNKAGEPLTGRKISFHLYPLAQMELSKIESPLETQQSLEERLILGGYPELLQLETFRKKSEYLLELIQFYLLKDILSFEGIRQPDKILRLLRLIAYQLGSEVSYNELGTQLGISKNTVENYLDLLTKVFIIYRLPPILPIIGRKYQKALNGTSSIMASETPSSMISSFCPSAMTSAHYGRTTLCQNGSNGTSTSARMSNTIFGGPIASRRLTSWRFEVESFRLLN